MGDNGAQPIFRWRGEWGPASILAMAQLAALLIGGVYTYARLENTAANTKDTATTLQQIVERQQNRIGETNDRLIKVETLVGSMATALTRIDQKLDTIKR